LKHEELTWPDIEMIWAKTSGYRLNHLKSTNFSPSEIYKTWPQYMQPLGYKLVSKLIPGADWPGGTPGQIPVAWYNNRLNGLIIF